MKLKDWARRMRSELWVLYYAFRDPRTKWYSKLLVVLTLAYALSPLDLIPDFIPVIGLIDDFVIVPLGIFLAMKSVPREVLAECRARAEQPVNDKRLRRAGLALVVLVWVAAAAAVFWALMR